MQIERLIDWELTEHNTLWSVTIDDTMNVERKFLNGNGWKTKLYLFIIHQSAKSIHKCLFDQSREKPFEKWREKLRWANIYRKGATFDVCVNIFSAFIFIINVFRNLRNRIQNWVSRSGECDWVRARIWWPNIVA